EFYSSLDPMFGTTEKSWSQEFIKLSTGEVFDITLEPDGSFQIVRTAQRYDLSQNALAGDLSNQAINAGNTYLLSDNISFIPTDPIDNGNVLQIQNQSVQADGSTVITGLWNGQSGAGVPSRDETGNLHITFDTGTQSLDGTISSNADGSYHLEAAATI